MNLFNKLSKIIKDKFFDDQSTNEKDPNLIEYKILVLGEPQVGKSSICNRFTLNEFNLEIKSTTQTECSTKSVKLGDEMIKLYIIDIDENVMSNDRSHLYADVKGAIIVYDVTKSKSFDKIENWILDLRQNTSMNIPIVIVGNKSDLINLKNVDYEEGLEKANGINCEFKETSCIDIESVKDAFKLLITKIFYHDLPESKKNFFKIYFSNKLNNENLDQNENEKEKEKENLEENI